MLFDHNLATESVIRQKIRDFYRIDENLAIEHILPDAEFNISARSRAWERARKMVLQIRQDQQGNGVVEALLNEYSLSSEEGIVLMCLAEALLRIPDKQTQDQLISDKLAEGQWSSHIGNSDSLFVNASSWGLLLTGHLVNYANQRNQFGLLKKTLGKVGEPVIRKSMNIAMKVMGQQFVMGEIIEDAVKRAQKKERKGYVYSYDMLGEGARTQKDADAYFNAYAQSIKVIGQAAQGKGPRRSPGISIKLSAIHPRYEFAHRARVLKELPEKLMNLCLLAKEYDIGLTIDAEESERLDLSLDIIELVFSNTDLGDWTGFGLAVQAYQKRAIFVIDWVRELTEKVGRKMMVRLVKGAYWDTEIKNTQKDGLSHFPVFTRKSSTDVSYHACANRLLDYRDTIFPQFATHNAYTAAVIIELAGDDKAGFEFQCLHGMGDSLYDQIVAVENIQCRIYAPVGEHKDLLAYLVRRLLENGANSSFVNAIIDEQRPVESLLEDPVEKTQRLKSKYNEQIQRPINLYGAERDNSKGLDLTDINVITPLKAAIDTWVAEHQLTEDQIPNDCHAVLNPANHHELIGFHHYDTIEQMKDKLTIADQAFASWSKVKPNERANLLRRTADILERHRDELISLCIKEAGKVTKDAVDEIREAVDFCRYYAAQVEQLAEDERLSSRGVVLCISPWNFPLAIFLGQVAAAIATGNTVIAKPAEQTSLIALRALELMAYVGLPKGVIESIVAPGTEVGATLLPDHRIKAVMFTGSTATGRLIASTLAERGGEQVPLIAETGGQNCMIVDSSALPEQVVDDVITSGFQSAGQRCSALRVLYLQEEIADTIIDMLIGAMKELTIGDPGYLCTDIGPVIDEKALSTLQFHADDMHKNATLLYECKIPEHSGTYFVPRLYLIKGITELKREVFGPCVHIITYNAKDIENVMMQINATGFGLTMGIHTRIDTRALELIKLSKAGNVYVNRNVIGAVVGSQPFGGRGLSGTGPKAGGPHYLTRLMVEKATPRETQANRGKIDVALISDDSAKKAAKRFMENAIDSEKSWRLTELNNRISAVRQLLAKIATVDIVEDFADDLNSTLSSARSQLISIEKRLKKPTILPGPTGESNVLYLEPRGIILCFADKDATFEYWTLSIVTALATGNVVIAVVSELFYDEALAFRDKFISTGAADGVFQIAKLEHLDALLNANKLAGVVIDSHCDRTTHMVQKLALRLGPILPVITAEYYDHLIQRLLMEKTVSIDTTASGGNTSLMTLVEEDAD